MRMWFNKRMLKNMNIENIVIIMKYERLPYLQDFINGLGEAMKYNLRCNRNISEKMTKKDFVYDIRPPIQSSRKLEEGKYPIVLPLQLRKKHSTDSKMPQYSVISEKNDYNQNDDEMNFSEQRALKFECNFCHEQIATLLSLSTHIKFHRRRYCKYCYWILPENETMKEHIESTHRIDPGMNTCTMNFSI